MLRRIISEHAHDQIPYPELDEIIRRLAQRRAAFTHHVPRPKRK